MPVSAGADVALGDIIGNLFFAGAADVGAGAAADVGAGVAADIGLGAADVGAGAAAGLGAEVAAGTAPEVLASAAPAIAAGDIGAQVAAEGGLAATDLGAVGAEAIGPTLAGAIDTSAPAIDTIASESLGGFAPTAGLNATDVAAVPAQGLNIGGSAAGTTAGIPAAPGAAFNVADTIASPSSALADVSGAAQNTNLLLGGDLPTQPFPQGAGLAQASTAGDVASAPGVSDALNFASDTSTATDASGLGPAAVHTPDVDTFPVGGGAAATPSAGVGQFGSDAAASASTATDVAGQIAAEGGISPTANAVSANAMDAAAAAPSTASTIGSDINSVLSSPYFKAASLALPAGMLAYDLFKGPSPIPPQAQQAINNAQNTANQLGPQVAQNLPQWNAAAAQDLSAAQSFQLTPGMAAQIDQFVQQSTNQLYQQLANRGMTDPTQNTDYIKGIQDINQQALAMKQQMVQQLFTQAMQSQQTVNAGVSTDANLNAQLDNTLMQAAQLQAQADAAFNTSVGNAVSALGQVAAITALGSGGTKQPINIYTPGTSPVTTSGATA